MKRQIVYLMSKPAHLPYLVVSLESLRKHWDGKIKVYAWAESYDLVKRIAEDERLGIKASLFDPCHKGRNAQFECKQRVMQWTDCDAGLYLDADTMIWSSLDLLFERAERFGFAATQYCDRYTDWLIIRNRIKRLRTFPEIDNELIEKLLTNRWPTVNGGVFACKPSSPVLPLWHKWTKAAREIYIADEVVLHTMMVKFGLSMEMTVVMEQGKYNCSTMTYLHPQGLRDDHVHVWHFHGDKCVKINDKRPHEGHWSPKGIGLWWPAFCSAVNRNVGGMQEWWKDVDNKHLMNLYDRVTI
ncbi:hypothetical protein LCGC14_0249540 [marine sediment metagenome]|uniref:Nucleotide-diphospho-sugar transferase domain-containing protein n=1 Tax=marine sediment metagenome TaxID=412755 RepID=A0A0F9WQB7_9ZZZZ